MTNLEIGLIVSVAVLAVAVAVLCVLFVKAQKKSKGQTSLKADTVYVKKGERYSVNDKIFDENGEANATHREGDFVLSVNTEYTVGDKGGILPGHYSILTSGERDTVFYARLGGFVREVAHGEGIELKTGDKITAVSHSLILR